MSRRRLRRTVVAVMDDGTKQPVDKEALRLAADHGVDGTRLRAYDALARSRGVGLDEVLRAALRGDLRDVVLLPKRTPPANELDRRREVG